MEATKREHTEHVASAIPGAGLMILPNVSHFAPVQAPALFNAAVLQFLDGEPKKGPWDQGGMSHGRGNQEFRANGLTIH